MSFFEGLEQSRREMSTNIRHYEYPQTKRGCPPIIITWVNESSRKNADEIGVSQIVGRVRSRMQFLSNGRTAISIRFGFLFTAIKAALVSRSYLGFQL